MAKDDETRLKALSIKLQAKLKDYTEAHKFQNKFKGLRFFERRKLERQLKKVNNMKSVAKEESELKRLCEKEEMIKSDIMYVKVTV